MTGKNEPAGIWVRVSTGGQDEENQLPDVLKYCQDRGYRIVRKYELSDKSASKGEQQKNLDQVIEDMRDATIRVIVCWHSDRMERRGPEALFKLLSQVRDAGGRIESTREPLLGAQDLSGEALAALGAVMAHQYTVHLAEQVGIAYDRIRANGAVGPGGIPWGFNVLGPKYEKRLVPTDLCRKYIPQIFQRCIDGQSCRAIAEWLDSESVPPRRGTLWNAGSVLKIIHNRVYAGLWQNEDKTRTIAKCEAVITIDVWDCADQTLKTRPKRGPVKKDNRPMMANLKCARCADRGIDSPMFRIRLRSRSGRYYYYYRCSGRGAQRKGCGNMVPYGQAEIIVATQVLMTSDERHMIREWVEGTNYDAEISEVNQDIRELAQNPLAEGFLHKMAELTAKLAELTEKNEQREHGHYEYTDTEMTVGEMFNGLDAEGKREYLRAHDIAVEKVRLELKPGGKWGVRVVMDGWDHGVFPYMPSADVDGAAFTAGEPGPRDR